MGRRSRRQHVHGIVDGCGRRQQLSKCDFSCRGEVDDLETVRLTGIGGKDARASSIGHNRDSTPRRERLPRQNRRNVE